MTSPYQQVPNSQNSPAGLGSIGPLNLNGVGNGNQTSQATNLTNATPWLNLDPQNQPPVMKTLVYSPDIRVTIATSGGKEYDVSDDVVRGSLTRSENAVSVFSCELANSHGKYTKNGGLFGRMDRIMVYMKRVNWVQVFSGYLDVVPFAQMWAGNVPIRASCTMKRLLYTYWNPNLVQSQSMFNQFRLMDANPLSDQGIGALLGNLICWIGRWSPANVHIQEFPTTFYQAMLPEFQQMVRQSGATFDDFQTLLEGLDHSPGPGSFADQKNISTGPGLGPQVVGAPAYQQQVLAAVDARGMGPNTADIQNSYQTEQLSATGQGTQNASVSAAFEQNMSLASTVQAQARTADAAILAFACVIAESGWVMFANPTVPDSLNYHYDMPVSKDIGGGTGLGLFQLPNGSGSVSQRMNAYASAGIFLDGLSAISGWQNMDPATVISRVQKNNVPEKYMATLEAARELVQGIRASQGAYTPQNLPNGIGVSSLSSLTSLGQTLSTTASTLGSSIPGVSQNSPTPSALPVDTPGRPQPDAQGAVNCALSVQGSPYVVGGSAPGGFDSAGLIWYAYKSIGRDVGKTVSAQAAGARQKIGSLAEAQPGDVIQVNGQHSAMLVAPGMIVEASAVGEPVSVKPIYFSPAQITGIYRYENWGGPGPAPFNPAAGPGAPVGTGYMGGTGVGSDNAQEPIARNLFAYMFTPQFNADIGNFFGGQKSFITSQPLMQEIQAVAKAGLRNFCSAPNGDFIAYYPDYFGVDGKPIAMTIENIEMKEVRINLSDDPLTTHVYVNGSHNNAMAHVDSSLAGWITSAGVATVENEALYQRLKQVIPGKLEDMSGNALLQKYGVRPLVLEFSSIGGQMLEFMMACQIFMQKWAEQFNTTAKFTFMPELFPGMRVQLAQTGIAVYIHEVTHCLRGSERYLTKDGTKTLAETVGTTQMVLGASGEWTPAEIKSYGEQQLHKIVLTRCGKKKEVYATAPHRWFKKRKRKTGRPPNGESKWVEVTTENLSPGDVLQSKYKTPHLSKRLSPVGVQAGIVFGDGTVHRDTNTAIVRLFGKKDAQLLKWFPLSFTTSGVHPEGNHVPFTEVQDLPAYFKKPPPLDEAPSYLRGWLAGYFAADGNVTESDSQAFLTSTNQEHFQVARDVCNVLGIRTTSTIWKGSSKFKENFTAYRLRLDINDLPEDFFLINEHRIRAVAQKSKWTAKRRRAMQDWTVESVTPTEMNEEVYCAVVPNGHAFTLEDNLLTGNSFDMEQGFSTEAQIMAPSSPDSGQRVDGYNMPADATTSAVPTSV